VESADALPVYPNSFFFLADVRTEFGDSGSTASIVRLLLRVCEAMAGVFWVFLRILKVDSSLRAIRITRVRVGVIYLYIYLYVIIQKQLQLLEYTKKTRLIRLIRYLRI
jgi:hypothetical protein